MKQINDKSFTFMSIGSFKYYQYPMDLFIKEANLMYDIFFDIVIEVRKCYAI